MPRALSWVCGLALVAVAGRAAAHAATEPSAGQEPTAGQIVARNVAARGGLEAWRKVSTMVWMGHLERANAPEPSMVFALEMKRPNKTRFEIHAMHQTTTRIFDGAQGWKTRPGGGGGHNLMPYTPEEVRFARDAQTIDGPLIDCEARGSTVTLEGVESLEGRKTYHLTVLFASGERQAVWIDAQSFLDVRVDRMSPTHIRGALGSAETVPVYLRNYKTIEGLQIPTTLEIGMGHGANPDRMVIERVAVNPPLADRLFSNADSASGRRVAAGAPASGTGSHLQGSMPR